MLPIDIAMPVQEVEMVQVASNTSQARKPRVATRCGISSDQSGGQFYSSLLTDIMQSLSRNERPKMLSNDDVNLVMAAAIIVKQPKHGQVELDFSGVTYHPNEGFEGEDRFTLQTEYEGQQFILHYRVDVSPVGDASFSSEHNCNKPPFTWRKNPASLLDGLNVSFSDLLGSAVAQTTDTQITLDTNAAGYGWFIDYTPYLNEEWLPTSNPLEWQAKPGSEAEGKMDLLSVLLHEYGHVLGIEHSADSHDLMATTLQPGVRRLPSDAELSQMAQLLGSLKTELGISSSSSSSTHDEPGIPTPLPVSVGLAAFLASRQRRNDSELSASQTAQTQYETVANPALTNADFGNAQGWSTTGTVVFENGTASRTVLVDLDDIDPGTVVNLSFDLIGFGFGAAATNSHVTVNRLNLGATLPGTEPGTDPGTDPGTEPGTDPGTEPGTGEPGTGTGTEGPETGTGEPGSGETGSGETPPDIKLPVTVDENGEERPILSQPDDYQPTSPVPPTQTDPVADIPPTIPQKPAWTPDDRMPHVFVELDEPEFEPEPRNDSSSSAPQEEKDPEPAVPEDVKRLVSLDPAVTDQPGLDRLSIGGGEEDNTPPSKVSLRQCKKRFKPRKRRQASMRQFPIKATNNSGKSPPSSSP